MSSLKEAFQEFDELDDVVYDIDNKDDLDRLKKSLDDDEDDLENIEKIVDIEATDEEDLEQSYVGKLLLYCPFCHTIHYANKEDVVESEDDPEYVNVGEQCPECSQIEGFEVIGEVAPVDGAQPDTEQGEEPEEENDIDLETEFGLPDEDEGEFEESFHKTKKSSFLERLVDNDCKKEDVDFDDNDDEIEIDEKVGAVLPKVRRKVKENLKAKKSLNENLTEAPVYGLEPRYDARKSFYGKAQVDTGDKGDKNKLYSYDTLVAEIKDGKPVVYGTYSQTTLRHIKDWLKQNGFKAESKAQIEKDYMTEGCDESMSYGELADYQNAWEEYKEKVGYVYNGDASTALEFIDEYVKEHPEYDNDEDRDAMLAGISAIEEPLEENLKEDSERDNLRATIKAQNHAKRQPSLKLAKKNQAPKKDAHKDDACKDEECKKKELDEALLVTCDFSDYKPWSGAVENYRVIEQEDKLDELENLLEECYPEGISMVEINDILWFDWEWVFDQLGISEDEEDFGESDEIDENLFDNLINKYCTRVYENVKDYKTTAGYTQGENLVLEGLLSFKSGKTANTKFIFEKKMVKDNQVKYVGLNESFSKSKKAFILNCKVDNKKIISESLTYNYKVNVSGEKKAVYGSIKNN